MTREEAVKVLEEMSLWKYCEPEAEAAKFAIAALREQDSLAKKTSDKKTSEWISVEERLPKRGEFVLLLYAKGAKNPTQWAKNTMAVGRYDYGMFLVEGCAVSVTHWMPLPDAPEVEG